MNVIHKDDRQQTILELIQQSRRVSVNQLSKRFGTSEITIRRDLHDLVASGRLVRTQRGRLVAAPALPEPPALQRMGLEKAFKEQIADCAARLVNDGETLFLTSGSTTTYLARCLRDRENLNILTNSLTIAQELSATGDGVTVVLIGGVLRKPELSLVGALAETSLKQFRVDKVFSGIQAISVDGGLSTDHIVEVQTSRSIYEIARELIVIADHTKLDRTAAAFIAPIESVTTLVTDRCADPGFLGKLGDLGIRTVIAEGKPCTGG